MRSAARLALFAALFASFGTPSAAWARAVGDHAPVNVAAQEDELWLAILRVNQTEIWRRTPDAAFDRVGFANGRIIDLVVGPTAGYAFFEDQSFYSIRNDGRGLAPERTLPERALPIALAADDQRLIALVPARIAAALEVASLRNDPAANEAEQSTGDDAAPPEPTIDAQSPRAWLLAFERGRWRPLVATPLELPQQTSPDRPQPSLGVGGGTAYLAQQAADRVRLWQVPIDGSRPIEYDARRIDNVQLATPLVVNAQPVLAVATRNGAQSLELQAFRIPDRADEPLAPLPLNVTPPEGVQLIRAERFFAFNQHLGVLAIDQAVPAADAPEHTFLLFARVDRAPLEESGSVAQIIADADQSFRYAEQMQFFIIIVLVASTVGVLMFRREALVTEAVLPAGMGLALVLQRFAALLIDLLPFTWLVVVAIQARGGSFDWQSGFGDLFGWVLGFGEQRGQPPSAPILVWWGISIFSYTTYALLMEFITGRTIGKVLMRIRIVDESGQPPGPWQIVIRNASRLIELIPLLWPIAIMALITPRRQRLGDIFARTLVVQDSRRHFQRTLTLRNVRRPDEKPAEPQQDADEGAANGDDGKREKGAESADRPDPENKEDKTDERT